MKIGLKQLMGNLFGRGAETSGVRSSAPEPSGREKRVLPKPAISAVEMAGTLSHTRDFLAERSKLVGGVGWETLARMPEWIGAGTTTSDILTRTLWSGVLGGAAKISPVIGRMPLDTASLLGFVESRKNLYRYRRGGEGVSLDEMLPPRSFPTENVVGEATSAGSAILKRLSDVWGKGTGEKPVSPQRIGRVVMRHPAPPAPRAEMTLPWQEPETIETAAGATIEPAPPAEEGEKTSGTLSPISKAVSAGRDAIRRMLKIAEAPIPEGTKPAPSAGRPTAPPVTIFRKEAETIETPVMPLVEEIFEREATESTKETPAIVPPLEMPALGFSRKVAERVEKIVPNLGERFPLAAGALLEKVPAEARKPIASTAGTTSKLFRSFAGIEMPRALTGVEKLIREAKNKPESIVGKTVEKLATPEEKEILSAAERLEKPLAEAAKSPEQALASALAAVGAGGKLEEIERSVTETARSPEQALASALEVMGAGGEIEKLERTISQSPAAAVAWAKQIASSHLPTMPRRVSDMLRALSIPLPTRITEVPEEEASGAIESALRGLPETFELPSFGGIAEHPEESMASLERAVSRFMGSPLEAAGRIVGVPEMPLAVPSEVREVAEKAVGGVVGRAGEAISSTLPAGEVERVESEVTKVVGVAGEGLPKLPDLDDLTDEIYRRLIRRLEMEREIRGL